MSPEIFLHTPLNELMKQAAALRDCGHGRNISYSRKVFIPLTQLCRDVCGYCTFAKSPGTQRKAYLDRDDVLEIARAGMETGCREALFTLGDKPELRYGAAREQLRELGHETTIDYLIESCRAVFEQTGLLPHVNAGVMGPEALRALREVSVSQGLMLESAADRLCARGGPHFGSPDKAPQTRLATIRSAGQLAIPFTSGILIGIGETRIERIEALAALRDLHAEYGHIQEIIVQNFRAKPGTRMANAPEPSLEDLQWTIAVARIMFGADMSIQAPPNLSGNDFAQLIDAGLNDWGGVSPVTADHVNPEAPWPHIRRLAEETGRCGKVLVQRLAIVPAFAREPETWLAPPMARAVLHLSDGQGLAREDDWAPGKPMALPEIGTGLTWVDSRVVDIVARAVQGDTLPSDNIVRLFAARDSDFDYVCHSADRLRESVSGNAISYVITRNINYTNICAHKCTFCAFSKGRGSSSRRGSPYNLDFEEVAGRAREAWARGATEVCMQGGIHPAYTGETYLSLCRAVKEAVPDIHVHAFSPLEVAHGARTLGVSIDTYLATLRNAGLGSLPGTSAEILDDRVRAIICPDKLSTAQWLDVLEAAHVAGMKTTSTIMFGHVDNYDSWAAHLLHLRALQQRTGGITEFVPLPFVHMQAPIHMAGHSRSGPTFRETILMHAVARLALHPLIPNIQVSWVKLGEKGAASCLGAGANDLGGTLMNESISSAAGADHGQEMTPERMEKLIRSLGRTPRRRTTMYKDAPADRRQPLPLIHVAPSRAPDPPALALARENVS